MSYRFTARSAVPGARRFQTGFWAGLVAAASVLNGVDRGDGSLGTYSGGGDFPDVGNVTTDDTTNGAAGTFLVPAAADVHDGVRYGAGGTEFTGTYGAIAPPAAALELSDFDECLVADVSVYLAEFGEAVIVHPVAAVDRSVTGVVVRAKTEMKDQPRGVLAPVAVSLPNSAATGISGAEWDNRFEVTVPRYRGGPSVRMRTVRALQQDAALMTWELA